METLKKFVVALFTLLVVACEGWVPPEDETAQVTNISCDQKIFTDFNPSNLNEEQKNLVMSALRTWGAMEPNWNERAHNFVKIATQEDYDNNKLKEIHGGMTYSPTNEECDTKYTEIYISPNSAKDTSKLFKIILHELGHHLSRVNGIKHKELHLPPKNIMTAYVSDMSDSLTESDYEYAGMTQ